MIVKLTYIHSVAMNWEKISVSKKFPFVKSKFRITEEEKNSKFKVLY